MNTTSNPSPQQVHARQANLRSKWSKSDTEQRRETAHRRQAELFARITDAELKS